MEEEIENVIEVSTTIIPDYANEEGLEGGVE